MPQPNQKKDELKLGRILKAAQMLKRLHTAPVHRTLGKHYIREWRQFRKLSLRTLADRLEIEPGVPLMSFANLGRIETGVQPYTQEALEALALALDCSVADLLSVNPKHRGEVIDLLKLIDDKNIEQAVRILRALTNAA